MPVHTHSAAETRRLGAALGAQLEPGDVVLLHGDMGAGKSELARGIARGLGVSGPVPSPSFTILNAYPDARVPFQHFDWYRVSDASELEESGLDEVIGDGVTVIEWPERAPALWPSRRLEITIRKLSDEARAIALLEVGGFRRLELEEWDT